ncbi:MAG TPA: ribonuclease H-like domain-containing protein [Candidatus Bathyarchaeia archaeon]|nr:ribonuclease H-like domain-containing protein [Candidatus Bathyarchaeia archaeon]
MAAKIVILDIETTSLEADAGVLVGAGLMSDTGRGEYLEARRTRDEKLLLTKLSKRLESYDVMVTWNGRSFDIPFLTTRLMRHGLDPRPFLRKPHIDLADVVKSRLRLTFTYLDHVCDFFQVDRKRGPMGLDVPYLHVRALEGDSSALLSIRDHCLDDLRATRQVFFKLKPLVEQQLEYAEGQS